jgi:hypothetical protein
MALEEKSEVAYPTTDFQKAEAEFEEVVEAC